MEQKTKKPRFRLNLFDAIILLIALGVGAYFAWTALGPDNSATVVTNEREVRYTIVMQNCKTGTGALVSEGDMLEDTLKNFAIGTVTSASTAQAKTLVVDNAGARKVMTDIPGAEDVTIYVTATATESDSQLIVGGGYELRVGARIYMRGPGYLGSGFIVAIERNSEDVK